MIFTDDEFQDKAICDIMNQISKEMPLTFENWITVKNYITCAYTIGFNRCRLNRQKNKFKPVLQIKHNQIIAEYPSVADAARRINGRYQGISQVLIGYRNTYKGYFWKLKNQENGI